MMLCPASKSERAEILERKRRCVREVYDYLGRMIAEQWSRKEVCARREIYDRKEGFWKGEVAEREEPVDLELMYLIHRLLRADLDYLGRISNPELQRREIDALRFKGCLACLAIYGGNTTCSELFLDFLFHVTGLVVDAGEGEKQDQNKIGFSINHLSDMWDRWRYWGRKPNCIILSRDTDARNEFKRRINEIHREFFHGKYDLMAYLKTIATTFRPRLLRPTFWRLYFLPYTPAKGVSRFRLRVQQGNCRRHVSESEVQDA